MEGALREALALGHNYIGTEHILLGLVRENEGVQSEGLRILEVLGVTAEQIYNDVIRCVNGPVTSYKAPDDIEDDTYTLKFRRPDLWQATGLVWPPERPRYRADKRTVIFDADSFADACDSAEAALLWGWSNKPHNCEILSIQELDLPSGQSPILRV